MEVNCVKLENDKEYVIMDIIINDIGKYLILVQEDNEYDIQVRKIVKIDNQECLTKLDTEEEFDNVIKEFYIKRNRKGDNSEE